MFSARRELSGGDDLGLDRLVLRIGDQARIEQLLRLLQPAHCIALTRSAECGGRGGHLDAARARPQLLQLAHTALLAPCLVLALTDAIQGLPLAAAQSAEPDLLRAAGAEGSEVGCLASADRELRAQHADAQRDLLEILPADGGDLEPAEEPAIEHDQTSAGRRDQESAVRKREQPHLDGPRLDGLAVDQHRAQLREWPLESRLVPWRG